MHPNQTWLNGLANRAPIGAVSPLAQFHTQSLIIGIGDAGAKCLELLYNRLQDTQVAPRNAPTTRIENQPELLHIGFRHVGPQGTRPLNAPIDSALLENPRQPQGPRDAEMWQWLAQNPMDVAFNNNQISRRSARIALFNHLALGPDAALLYLQLREKLRDAGYVYIIGSAVEHAGANIVGDIAALVRLATAGGPPIHIMALVPLEDKDPANNDLPNGGPEPLRYQSATLYELRRLTTETHRYIRLGNHNSLFYNPIGTSVLDNAVVLMGVNGMGLNRAMQVVWGMLTSQAFATNVKTTQPNLSQNRHHQTVNIAYTRALIWPTRLLRDIYTEQIVLGHIGPDATFPNPLNINARNPNDRLAQLRERMNEWLEGYRPFGLLPTLISFANELQATPAREYLVRLRTVFQDARQYAQREFGNAKTQIVQIDREQELGYFQLPVPDANTWRDAVVPSAAIDTLREHIGWVPTGNANSPIQLAYQGPRPNQPLYIYQVAPLGMPQYVEKVRELAERIASLYVAQEAVDFLQNLQQPMYSVLAGPWRERYGKWDADFRTQYSNQNRLIDDGAGPQIKRFSINAPEGQGSPWRPPFPTTMCGGADRTFALQALIATGISVEDLLITSGNGRLVNTVHLVDLPEVLTMRYLGTLNVDVRLQNALAEIEAFRAFATCMAYGLYQTLREQLEQYLPNWPAFDEVPNWIDLLERFLSQYRKDKIFRDRIKGFITGTTLPENWEAHLPPINTADTLNKAIRAVMAEQR